MYLGSTERAMRKFGARTIRRGFMERVADLRPGPQVQVGYPQAEWSTMISRHRSGKDSKYLLES